MVQSVVSAPRFAWNGQAVTEGERTIPEEVAVALTYNGGTYAVMMATPQNLEDFALGFSITEGIISSRDDLRGLEIIEESAGIELRMWLDADSARDLNDRRRRLAGPTGCGLCGIESLAEAVRPPPPVSGGWRFSPADITRALDGLAPRQELNRLTRAVHAAAFWRPQTGVVVLREDVGRHNALDKLCGALARDGIPGSPGIVLLTSRVSIEMVQKTAMTGIPVMVAVSAPTALAVRTADAAGITLIAVARKDGFEVFTHPHRISGAAAAHVA